MWRNFRVDLRSYLLVFSAISAPSVFLLALLAGASLEAQGQGLVDLGVLPGGNWTSARAINNSGVIVGKGNDADTVWHWVKWQDGQISSLFTTPDGFQSSWNCARDINSAGVVAGTIDLRSNNGMRAARWSSGAMETIPPIPQGSWSNGCGLNDSGWVVGDYVDSVVSPIWGTRGFLWKADSVIKLPTFHPGGRSYAKKINNSGVAVGWSTPSASPLYWTASAWFNGRLYALPPVSGYARSFAFDINDSNTIVGVSDPGEGSNDGILTTWKVTIVNGTDLEVSGPTALPSRYSFQVFYEFSAQPPVAINNLDLIAGVGADSLDGQQHPFVCFNGSFGDLSGLFTISQNYQYHLSAIDINDSGQIVGDIQGSSSSNLHGFLLSSRILSVVSPGRDELIVAGERNTISWVHLGVKTVNIYYKVGEAGTWNLIADHYPADLHRFVWTPSDTLLAAKVRIRIEDVSSSTAAESDPFKCKGYVLTRADEAGDYVAFRPDQDGWSIRNDDAHMWPAAWYNQFDYWTVNDPNTGLKYPPDNPPGLLYYPFHDSREQHFIDWPLFAETFGLNQCYIKAADSALQYRRSATLFWESVKSSQFGGACFGFSQSSLLAFDRKETFLLSTGLPNFSKLFDVSVTDSNRKVINRLYETQFGAATLDHRTNSASKTAVDILAELKASLLSSTDDHCSMGIYQLAPKPGGHSVVPYRVIRDPGNPALYRVYVYDSNHPGDTSKFLAVDTVANQWTYAALGWTGTAAGSWILRPSASHFLDQPELRSAGEPRPPIVAETRGDLGYMGIYNSDAAYVRIQAVIGSSWGQVTYDTTNGILLEGPTAPVPVIPETGSLNRPLGFFVPRSQDCSYNINLSQWRDSSISVVIRTDSVIWRYSRHHADSTQSDFLVYSESSTQKEILVYYGDEGSRRVDIAAILPGDTVERALDLTIHTLDPGNSIQAAVLPNGDFVITNLQTGFPTYCDLKLSRVSAGGTGLFKKDSLHLDGETRYIIKRPHWDSLNTAPLKILIDHSDWGWGVIDDSLILNNQLTGVDESGQSDQLPHKFELAQNYPNPFNPTTTIEYSVPRHSPVKVEIFNVLGERVRQLVNERKAAGTYRIDWSGTDDAGRPVATGVYFYRFSADNQVQTRKMLLLK